MRPRAQTSVVDPDRIVVGIITLDDILRRLAGPLVAFSELVARSGISSR